MSTSEQFDSTIHDVVSTSQPQGSIINEQIITFKRVQDLSINSRSDEHSMNFHGALTLPSRDQSSPFISRPGSPITEITPRCSSSPSATIRNSYTPDHPIDDVLNLQARVSLLNISKSEPTATLANPSVDGFAHDDILTIDSLSPRRSIKSTKNLSMWRHMRPMMPQQNPVFQDDPDLKHRERDTRTTSREEYLNKELIELKIKYVKLREFLIDLVDKSSKDPSHIRDILAHSENETASDLEMKLQSSQIQYDEAMKLNSDLHASLSTFESKLRDKETQIDHLQSQLHSVRASVDDLIKATMNDKGAGVLSDHALQLHLLPNLEEKLDALKQAMLARLETVPLTHSTLNSLGRIEESVDTVQQLLLRISNLEVYHQNERDHLKAEISMHRSESNRIRRTFEIMTSKFNELKNFVDSKESRITDDSAKIREYELVISELQKELQILKQSDSDIQGSPNRSQDQLDVMTNRVGDLSMKLQQKNIELRKQLEVSTNLKIQLENSLQKERGLRTEHIKLTTAEDVLRKENENLAAKLDAANINLESIRKKMASMEFRYKEFLLFDAAEFKKLIQSYDKIADDRSLTDSKSKYEKLYPKINEMKPFDDSNDMESQQSHTEITNIHNSIFEFFVRATDILINDHIGLLLKETDNQEIKKLRDQVEKLAKDNESLQDELSKHEFGLEEDSLSPISKLRTSVLTQKWKAERERRILEDLEAKKRFHEMEMEIQKLKELNNSRKGGDV
ncbi:hypothetical protein Cantr_01074 [Candida viswanathii]|uniref:Uncharacterized protein n=1 Tax=Candida viswanathii TaxID=5486 RepID=A0A367YHT1_9ASCO|nr:hypothetical protein Cantr_01074 [Candida viswanathii]